MFHLLFVSSSQMTIGSIDAMNFGAETCGLPPDFRPRRKAARGAAALYDRRKTFLKPSKGNGRSDRTGWNHACLGDTSAR
jgi:hypothetical protein